MNNLTERGNHEHEMVGRRTERFTAKAKITTARISTTGEFLPA